MALLFEPKPRFHMEPSNRTETTFSFYDRSGQPMIAELRGMLQRWVDHMPEEHRARFASRVKHKGPGSQTEEDGFNAAFFELFMHEFLLGASTNVAVEPNYKGRTPDFSAYDGRFKYLVEATDLNVEKNSGLQQDWKELRALDSLDGIKSSYFRLWVHTEGKLRTELPKKPLIKRFQELVDNAVYEEVVDAMQSNNSSSGKSPTASFTHDDWVITGSLLPLETPSSETTARFIAGRRRGVGVINDVGKLREKLRGKAQTYKDLDHVIIAVRADRTVDRVAESLFGNEVMMIEDVEYPKVPLEIKNRFLERRFDGLWFGNEGPRYKNVIGVVIFYDVYPHRVADSQACFYANPYVEIQLPAWAQNLPHAEYRLDGSIRFVEGRKPETFMDDYVRFVSPWES